ncbi:hypothetical protein RRG08_054528 [Elysia crispata]|uniref:Uncharacterized protein n=1 Tax=Elysia crispata TaxID=231223 RepID=A0AAE1B8Y9_9GAST|nr:hypothetical protein RRG08_054528 [Elysia crispata]
MKVKDFLRLTVSCFSPKLKMIRASFVWVSTLAWSEPAASQAVTRTCGQEELGVDPCFSSQLDRGFGTAEEEFLS